MLNFMYITISSHFTSSFMDCHIIQDIKKTIKQSVYHDLPHNHPPVLQIVKGCPHCETFGNILMTQCTQ